MILIQILCPFLTLGLGHFTAYRGAEPYCRLCRRRGERWMGDDMQIRTTWWSTTKRKMR